MIQRNSLSEVGRFARPHGINGEITASLDYELSPDDLRCVIVEIEGIFVPFFVNSFRPKGHENYLLTIDGIESDNEAKLLSNKTIYALTNELPESFENEDSDGIYASDLIGWTITEDENPLGVIEDVDDSTANVLLIVKTIDGATIYVPLADELINAIDTDTNTVDVTLPDGIKDL
ncbi:MAG: ribosome maturation factor RimM [Muribaculaceae bacterium]|nr:ribosome maturation factor RimM [Muribaculaceae bacterium]